ncbi:MAG: FAD:protein FMN transferase [Bacteroidales bacterium]|nr:FAD:protein FMN transferase [Bacteroidales bacterium]
MMKILRYFTAIALLSSLIMSCTPRNRYISITGYAQGGTYTVKLNLNGNDGNVAATPVEIRDSIDAILQRIDSTLSGYNRNSLLSRFNAGDITYKESMKNSMFSDINQQAVKIFNETEGVVDVAAGPLFDLWGFGFRSGEFPSDEEVMKTKESCGMELLLAHETGKLNYNAIAQGYSCDLVASYLYSIGVKDMMVDIGEIFCDGVNPSGQAWSLGIDRPVDGNNELGAEIQGIFRAPEGPHGIVTSGNYRKFYIKDGKKYAHSIDPRTGYPVTHNMLSATIVAEDALTADAYATYCMVVGLEESIQLLQKREDLEGCLIYDEEGIFKTWCSEGFVLEEAK